MDIVRQLAHAITASSNHVVHTMSALMRDLRLEDEVEGRKLDLQRRIVTLACRHFECNSSV